ncbi:MAG: hypothetical protein Q7S72_01880 [Candidatus Taylorbacteria bacterium]|nr:hypothetical protein [Candidatus Taylorbacteria bacterium]
MNRKRLIVNTSLNASPRVCCISYNFRSFSFDLIKSEKRLRKAVSIILANDDSDHRVIARLGGALKVISHMREIHTFIEAKEVPGTGGLKIFYALQKIEKERGLKNFSYVDFFGVKVNEAVSDLQHLKKINCQWYVLRVVNACWDRLGWVLEARPIDAQKCFEGDQVILHI